MMGEIYKIGQKTVRNKTAEDCDLQNLNLISDIEIRSFRKSNT